MPRYIVDLRSLEEKERVAAFNLLKGYCFTANAIYGSNGLEGADVVWNLQHDFQSSAVYPKGCPCTLKAY